MVIIVGVCRLGGKVIIDEWFNPDPAQNPEGNHGINVRMYDPERKVWKMMWIADINRLDALINRKDPPFDKSYLHLTYLLEFLDPGVTQINSPVALRDVNEKLYTLKWPEYCPDTLVSRDIDMLLDFVARHDKTVVKPLDDCSDRGIQFIEATDPCGERKLRDMLKHEGYVLAQVFLPEVRAGGPGGLPEAPL